MLDHSDYFTSLFSKNGKNDMQSRTIANAVLRDLPRPFTADKEKAAFQKLASEKPGTPEYISTFNDIAMHNLRLVQTMAIKSAQTYKTGREVMDLFQTGYFGLVRAIERYNLSFGTRFSTYAVFWIQQSMQRYQKSDVAYHLPEYFYAKFNLIDRIRADLTQKLGRIPTNKEVSEVAMLSKNMEIQGGPRDLMEAYSYVSNRRRIERAKDPALYQLLSERLVSLGANYIDYLDALRNTIDVVSLNQRTDNTLCDSNEIVDLIKDPSDTPDEVSINQTSENALIKLAFSKLTDRERRVIVSRYGLAPNTEPCTMEELSKKMHLTSERVRQIEAKAFRKMYHTLIIAGYDLENIMPYQAV